VAQGKIQFPMFNQQRQQRSKELQIRQDYLKQAMESILGSSKYSNEVSSEGSGGGMKRIESPDNAKRKCVTCKSAIKQTN